MASSQLQCSICPKQPKFSDQSHLLTHISSKGHLSHYFKAQVRSRKDHVARESLECYDRWYERNDIERHLSQRMTSKESRPTRPQQRSLPRSSERAPLNSSLSPPDPAATSLLLRTSPSSLAFSEIDCIDPALERVGPYPAPTRGSTERHGQIAPPAPMFYRNEDTRSILSEHRHALTDLYKREDPTEYDQQLIPPVREETTSLVLNSTWNYTHKRQTAPPPEPFRSHRRYNSSNTHNVPDDDVNAEYCRLKGVIWPGMDLFDTATQDLKRRRNQKKDRSTLVRLQEDSEAIEANEFIYYYPSWDLKKSRFITGNVESSPPRELEPDPNPQVIPAKRFALEDLDPNVGVRGKKARTRAPKQHAVGHPSRKPNLKQESLSDDEELDLMAPWSQFKSNRGRKFEVYKDTNATQRELKVEVGPSFSMSTRTAQQHKSALRPSVNEAGSPLAKPACPAWDAPDHANPSDVTPGEGALADECPVYFSREIRESPPRFDMAKQPEIITPRRLLLQTGISYDRDNPMSHSLSLWPNAFNAAYPGWTADPSPGSLSFVDYFPSHGNGRLEHLQCDGTEIQLHHQSAPIDLTSSMRCKENIDPEINGYSSGDETIDLGLPIGT